MTSSRNKSAWIWVAIAALSLASVSRAEAGFESARAYAGPVLQFLAKSHSQVSAARPGVSPFAPRGPMRRIGSFFRDAGSGAWMAFLPVCFVGLVLLLCLFAGQTARYRGHTPAAPLLPAAFQRPPPRFV